MENFGNYMEIKFKALSVNEAFAKAELIAAVGGNKGVDLLLGGAAGAGDALLVELIAGETALTILPSSTVPHSFRGSCSLFSSSPPI